MALLVTENNIHVETLEVYSPEVDQAIGDLMPILDPKFVPERNEDLLREIIASPYHDQLVARYEGEVVGAASMSITMGRGFGKRGQLEDFVTRPKVTDGIGRVLVAGMKEWARRGDMDSIYLQTELEGRPKAVQFYDRTGAILLNDSLTLKYLTNEGDR